MERLLLGVCLVLATEPGGAQPTRPRTPQPNAPKTIEYTTRSRPSATWTLASAPLFAVDEEATSGLYNMSRVMRLSDDVIAIACEESFKLVDRTGTVLRTIGRSGRGPGEFVARLVDAWHTADTVRGMGGDSRVAIFTSTGTLLRTDARVSLPGGAVSSRIDYYPDGSSLVRASQDRRTYPAAQSFLTTLTLWRQFADGTQKELGAFPASSMVRIAGDRAVRLKFGGAGVVTRWRDGFCTGTSSTYGFGCYDSAGQPVFAIRDKQRVGRTVTAEDRAVVFDVDARANPGPEGAPQREATRRNARFADRLPAFGRLLTSPTGEVWVGPADVFDDTVGESQVPTTAARWSVYAADGRWIADISLPPGLVLTEVSEQWVAGIRVDIDGAQQAVVFTLRRK